MPSVGIEHTTLDSLESWVKAEVATEQAVHGPGVQELYVSLDTRDQSRANNNLGYVAWNRNFPVVRPLLKSSVSKVMFLL